MKTILVVAALLCAGIATTARADEKPCEQWCSPFFKSLPKEEYAYIAASTADMLTTFDIKNHKNLQESNPLLGTHPSDGKILAVVLAGDLLHAAITYELVDSGAPKSVVKAWEYVTIGIEAGFAAHNVHMGCRFRF